MDVELPIQEASSLDDIGDGDDEDRSEDSMDGSQEVAESPTLQELPLREEDAGELAAKKSSGFARMFTQLLEKPIKRKLEGSVILGSSKGIQRLQHEEEEQEAADREARKRRMEMRQRGHVKVHRKGENPDLDAKEKALQRIATRGVVKLFNAVKAAQKTVKEGEKKRTKGVAKLAKVSFLSELKGAGSGSVGRSATAPLAPGRGGGSDGGEAQPGWDVLRQGLLGLEGSKAKMKDWDRHTDGQDNPLAPAEVLPEQQSSGDDGDSGDDLLHAHAGRGGGDSDDGEAGRGRLEEEEEGEEEGEFEAEDGGW